VLPREDWVEILRRMREHRTGQVELLRSLEPKAREKEEAGDPFPLLVLRGGIEFNERLAAWCERTEAQLLDSAREEAGR
jgi:hypothetical protein